MVVHSMDSPEMFPYKRVHMRRAFKALQAMLHAFAGKPREHFGDTCPWSGSGSR